MMRWLWLRIDALLTALVNPGLLDLYRKENTRLSEEIAQVNDERNTFAARATELQRRVVEWERRVDCQNRLRIAPARERCGECRACLALELHQVKAELSIFRTFRQTGGYAPQQQGLSVLPSRRVTLLQQDSRNE